MRVASRLAIAGVIGLVVANCAQPPRTASRSTSKEVGAFADEKKYGKASPRVVSIDEDAPKGGGRYHVGNSYRVAGRTYVPSERPVGHSQSGLASWYGEAFHGRKTANGEVYDRRSYTAAHPTMPLPSYARVTNLRNNHSIIVRVNDRGPFHGGRVMDVSERVAGALNFKGEGTTRVRIDYLGRAGLAGSDDTKLMASLRTDGTPASSPAIGNSTSPVMVASAETARPAATLRPNAPVTAVSRPAPAASVPAEEDEAPVTAAAPLGTPVATPAALPARAVATTPLTPARGVPAPPDRPFDLGTIPGAGSPVPAVPAARPRYASLSFAPETASLSKFQQGNPLAGMPSARFAPAKPTKISSAR